MALKKRDKRISLALWVIGYAIIFGTHIFMLKVDLTKEQMIPHAVGNIVAGIMIMVATWMRLKK